MCMGVGSEGEGVENDVLVHGTGSLHVGGGFRGDLSPGQHQVHARQVGGSTNTGKQYFIYNIPTS